MVKKTNLFQWRMDKQKSDIVSTCDKNERFALHISLFIRLTMKIGGHND